MIKIRFVVISKKFYRVKGNYLQCYHISPLSLSGSTKVGNAMSRACIFESSLFKREFTFPVPLFTDGSSIDPVSMLHTSPIKVRLDRCFLQIQIIATYKVNRVYK